MPRTYIAPYRGPVNSLPPGYMQAATQPGRSMAAGLMSAGNSIAEGLEKYAAKKQEAEDQQKAQTAEFKALQSYAKAAGYADTDQTTTMDLPSLKGFVRAKEGEAVAQEQQHKLKQYQQAEATTQAMRDLQQIRAVTQGQLQPHQYAATLENNPQADPMGLAKYGQATDPQTAEQMKFIQAPGGATVAQLGKSMQVLPDQKAGEIGFKPFVDEAGSKVPGVYVDRSGKVIDLRETEDPYKAALARMLFPGGLAESDAGPAASSAAPAADEMWQRFQKRKPATSARDAIFNR